MSALESKLLKKYAASSEINIYNHKEKAIRTEPTQLDRDKPTNKNHWRRLYEQANKYFEKVLLQDKYIKIQGRLLDQYDAELQKLDAVIVEQEKQITILQVKERGIATVLSNSKAENLAIAMNGLVKAIKSNGATEGRAKDLLDRLTYIMGKITIVK
jgi:hypothetical protein